MKKWYFEDGTGNYAYQNTDGSQPKIVDAGVLVTAGGMPGMKFDGVDDFLQLNTTITGVGPWHVMMVGKRNASSEVGLVFGDSSSQYAAWLYSDNNWYARGREGFISSSSSGTLATQALMTTEWISGTSYTVYLNGTSLFSGTPSIATTQDFNYIGRRGSDYSKGILQELIMWSADKSADRSAMDTARKTVYSL